MRSPTGSSPEKIDVRMGRSATVQHESDGCVIGTIDDIVLVVWAKQPRLEQALSLRRVMDGLALKFERGSSVHVLYNRPELPEKRVRDEMARITHDLADRTIASALVLNGEGFWASAMRGLATSLHFLGSKRTRFKFRVCATAAQAAEWLAPVHSEQSRWRADSAEIEGALRDLCDRALGRRQP
jgi:hypothetical protein